MKKANTLKDNMKALYLNHFFTKYRQYCISPYKARFKVQDANDGFQRELKKYVPRPGMTQLYKEVLKHLYKEQTKRQRDDLRLIKNELEQENIRLSKARDLLVNSEIESSDYRIIKAACEKKITVLEAKLFHTNRTENDIESLLEKAVNVLEKLSCLYIDGDTRKERQIIGSIYPEKLIFDGINYRTARLNEAVELIYSIGAGFIENKNGQTEANFNLSKQVIRIGFEPMTYSLEGCRSIQLSYRTQSAAKVKNICV